MKIKTQKKAEVGWREYINCYDNHEIKNKQTNKQLKQNLRSSNQA